MTDTDNEIFFIRDEKSPILYAPLINFSARVNDDCAEAVKRKLDGEELPKDKAVLDYLASYGLFDKVELPERDTAPPTEVTLFISDICNLRCVYCYAECGDKQHPMPLDTGKAAIDLVIRNAVKLKRDTATIKFHGDGEPFTAFDTLKVLSQYARDKAKGNGISAHLTVVSNGFWSEDILAWVINEIDEVAISFDGTKDIQNTQRPTVSGAESFSAVDRTLRELSRNNKCFGIKATVTAESAGKITDIAKHVSESYPGCGWLQLEPVWNVGRYVDADDPPEFFDRFINGFISADRLYGDKINIVYSTANIDKICVCNCNVPNGQFIVTSRGAVTGCYEVFDDSDPRSDIFIYGRYDEVCGDFCFDDTKKEALHRYTIDNIPYCKDCFCKYHCAGDCPAKLLGNKPAESFKGSERCRITRALTAYFIGKRLS